MFFSLMYKIHLRILLQLLNHESNLEFVIENDIITKKLRTPFTNITLKDNFILNKCLIMIMLRVQMLY